MRHLLLSLARPYILLAVLASIFVNVLYLTSPIYMTQIYGRVLASGSQSTLLSLSLMMVVAFALLSVFERLRSWVFARLATRMDLHLSRALFDLQLSGHPDLAHSLRQSTTDLDQIKRFVAGPGPAALLDLPFMILYAVVLFAIHTWLGFYALFGVGTIMILVVLGFWFQSKTSQDHSLAKLVSYKALDVTEKGKDLVRAHGLSKPMAVLLHHRRMALSREEARSTAQAQTWSSLNKWLRLVLQSGILGLAAYLVLQQAISPALIFACMILLGRVLAPIDVLSNTWSSVLATHTAWKRLGQLPDSQGDEATAEDQSLILQSPEGRLQLAEAGFSVLEGDKDRVLLDGITLNVPPNSFTVVTGASGAGKSSLLRLLAGLQEPTQGQVLYDGLAAHSLAATQRRRLVAWSPQSPVFLPGSIAENISSFLEDPPAEDIVKAADMAEIHGRITQLPLGYQTPIDMVDFTFSGGERARLNLARALFQPAKVLLLDEPTAALEAGLRSQLAERFERLAKQGHTLVVASHDQALIHKASHILILEAGKVKAFGPRAQILSPQSLAVKSGGGRPAAMPQDDLMTPGDRVVTSIGNLPADMQKAIAGRKAVQATPSHTSPRHTSPSHQPKKREPHD